MKNVIKIPLIVIPSVLIIIFLFLSVFINSIVKKSIETFGPKYTQTPVELDKAKISLFSGRGEIDGLIVRNPEGFKTDSAFVLGKIIMEIEPMSLFSDKVIIRKIHVIGPEITYETSLKGSNIGRIKKNIESVSGGSPEEKPEGSPQEEKGQRKVQIDKFILQDGKLHLSATVLEGKTVDIPLKDIQFTDIGKETGGTSFYEVIQRIFTVIFDAVIETAKRSDKAIKEEIETLKDSAKGIEETTKESMTRMLDKMKKLFDK